MRLIILTLVPVLVLVGRTSDEDEDEDGEGERECGAGSPRLRKVHALPLLVTALRLTCWPFEVEGQGPPPDPPPGSSAAPPAGASAGPPAVAPAAVPDSLPRQEAVRYDIRYGLLGSIGSLSIDAGAVGYADPSTPVVIVRAAGRGAVLGLGGIERRIETEFDVRALGSRRWKEARRKEGAGPEHETVDLGERNARGENRIQRRAPGKAEQVQRFPSILPTSDLLGTIWRLRTAPPALGRTEVALVLDGLALWLVKAATVSTDDTVPDTAVHALRVEGELTPIDYNGAVDGGRTARHFTMWLDRGPSHLPLRLEVPVGPADVVLQLVESRRTVASAGDPAAAPLAQPGVPAPGARSL